MLSANARKRKRNLDTFAQEKYVDSLGAVLLNPRKRVRRVHVDSRVHSGGITQGAIAGEIVWEMDVSLDTTSEEQIMPSSISPSPPNHEEIPDVQHQHIVVAPVDMDPERIDEQSDGDMDLDSNGESDLDSNGESDEESALDSDGEMDLDSDGETDFDEDTPSDDEDVPSDQGMDVDESSEEEEDSDYDSEEEMDLDSDCDIDMQFDLDIPVQ